MSRVGGGRGGAAPAPTNSAHRGRLGRVQPFLMLFLAVALAVLPPGQPQEIYYLGAAKPPPDPHVGKHYRPLSATTGRYGAACSRAISPSIRSIRYDQPQRPAADDRGGRPA